MRQPRIYVTDRTADRAQVERARRAIDASLKVLAQGEPWPDWSRKKWPEPEVV